MREFQGLSSRHPKQQQNNNSTMSFADKFGAVFSRKGLIILAGIVILYTLWIYGLSTNPPGFYIDESCIAYNGYSIATTGAEEDGVKFPLYIHCYTQGWSQYM